MIATKAKDLKPGHVVTNHGPSERKVQAVEQVPGGVRVTFEELNGPRLFTPAHPFWVKVAA